MAHFSVSFIYYVYDWYEHNKMCHITEILQIHGYKWLDFAPTTFMQGKKNLKISKHVLLWNTFNRCAHKFLEAMLFCKWKSYDIATKKSQSMLCYISDMTTMYHKLYGHIQRPGSHYQASGTWRLINYGFLYGSEMSKYGPLWAPIE